jgi:SpoVK/Ycf46/Vps4 family AAA+-type ATPase
MAKSQVDQLVNIDDIDSGTAQSKTVQIKPLTTLEQDILARIKASYQVLYLHTPEMVRAEEMLRNIARELTKKVQETAHRRMMLITWDAVNGFTTSIGRDNGDNFVPESLRDPKYLNPANALDVIVPRIDGSCPVGSNLAESLPTFCVFAFMDFDDYMKDPRIRARVTQYSARQKLVTSHARHPLFIVSAVADIDTKTKPYVSVFDVPLPDEAELKTVLAFLSKSVKEHNTKEIKELTEEEETLIIDNLAGMTWLEAENVLSRCFLQFGTLSHPNVLSIIKKEKAGIIKKSEVLTYIPEESAANMEELLGFDGAITWLRRRKLSYSPAAKSQHIDTPRGVVLIGIPGTGKSVFAKAVCRELGLPGYVLDIGALFGSMVGESEKRVRDVLRILDAQKGCVLVIDEADKALGNAHQSTGDSGVTRRVFGAILTWLAENQSRTFVIMTLNRTEGMPPEMLRAGRFDKVFYTDVPAPAVRQQIFEIHFKKRGVTKEELNFSEESWAHLVERTDKFVGSEIEEAVKEARHMAMAAHGTGVPTLEHVMSAVSSIRPMAVTEEKVIEEMRAFCASKGTAVTGNAVAVASGAKPARKSRGRSVILDDESLTNEGLN